MTSAVIFDLDDTLFSERTFAYSGFAAVADAFAHTFGDERRAASRMCSLFDAGHRGRVFDQLLIEHGREQDADLIRRMIDVYRAHRPTIALYPDAEAALVRFHGRYKLGLLTDGPAVMQRAKVSALRLHERLDAIILTDELGSDFGKPNPAAFECIAQRLGVEHSGCVYVADNPTKDFVAPNALGWKTVRVLRPDGIYRLAETAPGGRPGRVIETLNQLDEGL